jgi:hypothetical protein
MGFAPLVTPSRSTTELHASRRAAFAELAIGFAAAATTLLVASPAVAADGGSTTWLTGKAPKVPGEKPKDKSETKDTRRDPSFLRSISDCKSQCEQTPGPDGLARAKEECLQDCQDICCKSYEQCTFAIVPR